MAEIILNILLALLPAGAIYLFYSRYFLFRPDYLDHIKSILYGIIVASLSVLFQKSFAPATPAISPIMTGFVWAALPEKSILLIVLYLIIRSKKNQIIAIETIVTGMLAGIGFSALENVGYALSTHSSMILIRYISAVPLHATTCGIMAYFLVRMRLSSSGWSRVVSAAIALWIPYLIHGSYDSLLFLGGNSSYLIGPLLVFSIALLEYLMSIARTLPPLEWLENMELTFEEWSMIQREPQYERWILQSMGSRTGGEIPFFLWNLRGRKLALVLLVAALSIAYLFLPPQTVEAWFPDLKLHEKFTLFVILPWTGVFNIIMVGAINPYFFRDRLIRIPVISDVTLKYDSTQLRTTTHEITSSGILVKTTEPIPRGKRVLVSFENRDAEPRQIMGRVVWSKRESAKHSGELLIRFSDAGSGFRLFAIRFHIRREFHSIIFHLRLPGFERLRKLFVRPSSVMQDVERLPAGTLLFREGDHGRRFFLIVKGTVEIFKSTASGEMIQMSQLGEGEIFGEMALVSDQKRTATAVCKTEALIATADADNLEALIESNPEFTRKLIEILLKRLSSSEHVLTGTIAELENLVYFQRRLNHSLLLLLLAGAGRLPDQSRLHLEVDTARIADHLHLRENDVETILSLQEEAASSELSRFARDPGTNELLDRLDGIDLEIRRKRNS